MLASKSGREFDVYVGIDAFGRGTPGGGGFNCKEVVGLFLLSFPLQLILVIKY